jgi:outer membrane protein OmpA-like peptidoglycan-associated protein
MLKITPLLVATTGFLLAGGNVFGMPLRLSEPDISFSVFFDPGAASLSKEGREIVAIAAMQFAAFHKGHTTARIFVNSETDGQDSASLSKARIAAVRDQLARDGIQRKFVSASEQPSIHAAPIRLLESLDRRVSISIQDSVIIGQT